VKLPPQMEWSEACTLGKRTTADLWSLRANAPRNSHCAPTLQARILEKTRQKPSDGSTHWSPRRLAEAMGLNHMLVARAWARAGVKLHRMKQYYGEQ